MKGFLLLLAILNLGLFLLNLELYIQWRGWWNLLALGTCLAAGIFITAIAVK